MNTIVIKKHKTEALWCRYEADPVDQPGTPRVGRGSTPFYALKDLLMNNDEFNINIVNETGEINWVI